MRSLEELPRHQVAVVERVGGERSFRRRLLEMGLIPGTEVKVINVAPFGDPLEIEVRQSRLSIRRHEARLIEVRR
jgi:Fe2+ transport system protein FeoA